MLYELTTLSVSLLGAPEAAKGALAWVGAPEAKGRLLGCWRAELGVLGRLILLRGFDAPHDMTVERHRALMSADPFHGGGAVTALEMDSYAGFPFLPPVEAAAGGDGVYEFRTYRLKPGGLPPTLAAWEAAVPGARPYTDHLVGNMYSLDGEPRITHIWQFSSLEERAALRARAFGDGVWPPKGGPDQVRLATATVGLLQG